MGERRGFADTLAARGLALFLAVAGLLSAEVVLGIALGDRMERAADELASIDRRGQAVLLAASKVNDMLADMAQAEFAPAARINQAILAHLHVHVVGMLPIEIEMRRLGREAGNMSVGALMERSTAAQIDPAPGAIRAFVADARPVVEAFAGEALKLLVSIDGERKSRARHVIETRAQFSFMMTLVGVGGAIGIALASGLFFWRLSQSLSSIRDKAAHIAAGEYGAPMQDGRRDELGAVIRAVNRLESSLADRDRQLDELRGRFSQQEKILALGTFATGMAHEIGNPIQAISALSAQISESLAEDPGPANVAANRKHVDAIVDQAERLSRTVAEIRNFAHPGKPHLERVDVNALVRRTADLMRFDPRFRRRLDVRCGAATPVVEAVADHLVQVVMNLLINAADAVEGGDGTIAIVTADCDDGVEIQVCDTGIGMAPPVLEHACEPFFTTKLRAKGTGLGLAICRTIIDQHRGSMRIASEPGAGTKVTLVIPRGLAS